MCCHTEPLTGEAVLFAILQVKRLCMCKCTNTTPEQNLCATVHECTSTCMRPPRRAVQARILLAPLAGVLAPLGLGLVNCRQLSDLLQYESHHAKHQAAIKRPITVAFQLSYRCFGSGIQLLFRTRHPALLFQRYLNSARIDRERSQKGNSRFSCDNHQQR